MSKPILALFGSLAVLGMTILFLAKSDRPNKRNAKNESLILLCAASNQSVVEAIRKEYEQEFGVSVQVQYGASQTLLSQLQVTNIGDVYLPADDSFLKLGKEKNLIAESLNIATMQAGAAVKKGNPKGIKDLASLMADGVRFVQANPEAAAIGKRTKEILGASKQWDGFEKATSSFRTTMPEAANDVVVGAADAAIVYDAAIATYDTLDFVEIPELKEVVSTVALGIVASTKQPSRALHFARYVAARDRGHVHYKKHGFQVLEGDQWSDSPELTLFAGSMLRPAIEETIIKFEEREGVHVSRTYNGCGILVGQMKSGQLPDAYFACDLEFMSQVKDVFPKSVNVSQNELVILVPKGNPKNIGSLRDLTREGLRVGVGHENQCAMGWITQKTFSEAGIKTEIMANVTVQTPTGDMLVNQMRTGALDAAVVYLSNASGAADVMEAIAIEGIPCSTATQPWAIAEDSKYPQLMRRLFEALTSAESKEIFEAEGFQWKLRLP